MPLRDSIEKCKDFILRDVEYTDWIAFNLQFDAQCLMVKRYTFTYTNDCIVQRNNNMNDDLHSRLYHGTMIHRTSLREIWYRHRCNSDIVNQRSTASRATYQSIMTRRFYRRSDISFLFIKIHLINFYVRVY